MSRSSVLGGVPGVSMCILLHSGTGHLRVAGNGITIGPE